MRYELNDFEWAAIRALLPNKPRGIPRADDRRVLNVIFWVLRSGVLLAGHEDFFRESADVKLAAIRRGTESVRLSSVEA